MTEGLKKDGTYDAETIPISLRKNKKYGLRHTVFEMDLASGNCDWGGKWTVEAHCQMLLKLFRWVRTEIYADARILINLRDFGHAMCVAPERVLRIIQFVAALPPAERIFGFVYEDLGDSMPEELESWTAATRGVMDAAGWTSGRLLVHIHEQWDLQTAATLGCLAYGADGMWASVCEEGAAVGHASSSVTVMNLVRLGNKKVLEKYNCTYLRKAARKVTQITTGRDPHPKQVIYGDRALDAVFGFPLDVVRAFNVAEFFGVTPPNRMNTLASSGMIRDRLVNVFGEDAQFTVEIGQKMKDLMLEDLRSGRKEEYMSAVGLALLFDRAGGKLTEKMSEVIANVKVKNQHHQDLIAELRALWDKWDLSDEVQGDDRLQFNSFYHGFMAPYFNSYQSDTQKALSALDMDADGYVDWQEFLVYIKWALNEYPKIETVDELVDTAFQKGLIPAMRDEKIKRM